MNPGGTSSILFGVVHFRVAKRVMCSLFRAHTTTPERAQAHVQYVTMYAGYTCDRSYTTHMRVASGYPYAVWGPAHTEWHPGGGFTSCFVLSSITWP